MHVGNAAEEVEEVGEGAIGDGAINRTAPIEAVGPHTGERTIAAAAEASHGEF